MPSFKYKAFNFDEYNDDELKRNNAVKLDSEQSKASLPNYTLTNENEETNSSYSVESGNKEINSFNSQKTNMNSKTMPDLFKSSNESDSIKRSISTLENHVHPIEKREETFNTNSSSTSLNKINFDSLKGGKIIDGIFDILLELFGIKNKIDWYNWLQHKAFLSFIQQFFGGTLDK